MDLINIYDAAHYNLKTVEKALRKCNDSVWEEISMQLHTDDFISTFKNKLNWTLVCRYNQLDEPFIKEHKELVDWETISHCQMWTK